MGATGRRRVAVGAFDGRVIVSIMTSGNGPDSPDVECERVTMTADEATKLSTEIDNMAKAVRGTR